MIKYHNLLLLQNKMIFQVFERYCHLFTLIYWNKFFIELTGVHGPGSKYPVIMKIFMDTCCPALYSADRKNRSEHIRRYPKTAVNNP